MSSSPEGNERKQDKRKIMQAMSQHKEPHDFLQLLREESSDLRPPDLLKNFFYTGNIIYIEQRNLRCITIFTDNSHLEDLKTRVLECRFQLSEMHKSWIPKPNKPGKMRPITPCKKDLIVMEALSLLLNIVYEDVFLTNSHGFRKGRGPITFFAHVDSWGTVDRFIKADIVGCFDNIDHTLLNRRIGLDMGESSEGFCNSIFQLSKGNKR